MGDTKTLADGLTARENAILKELAGGATHGEVAGDRGISQEELEIAILGILSKLEDAAMECVLSEEPEARTLQTA
ncbi:MAG: hypothetical protein HRF45_12735 [Fimbriimonadia bacterium]|jgi:DNA-binding NarL/FixJ family response regulator